MKSHCGMTSSSYSFYKIFFYDYDDEPFRSGQSLYFYTIVLTHKTQEASEKTTKEGFIGSMETSSILFIFFSIKLTSKSLQQSSFEKVTQSNRLMCAIIDSTITEKMKNLYEILNFTAESANFLLFFPTIVLWSCHTFAECRKN